MSVIISPTNWSDQLSSLSSTASLLDRSGAKSQQSEHTGSEDSRREAGRHPRVSALGSRPASQFSNHPCSQPGSQPSTQPGSQPSTHFGSQPSTHPGSQPSTHPGSQPSTHPGSRPSTHTGSRPSTHTGSRPSTHPGSRPSTQKSRHSPHTPPDVVHPRYQAQYNYVTPECGAYPVWRRPAAASKSSDSYLNPRYSHSVSYSGRNYYEDKFGGEIREASPLMTIIDKGALRRSGSVISESASLTNKNSIRRRNRMVKRKASTRSTASSSSQNSKNGKLKPKANTRYIFPIRRKASYRYVRQRRFTSQKDVDQYYSLNDLTSIMQDIIPKTMATFEYQKILRQEPELVSKQRTFEISKAGEFIPVLNRASSQRLSKVRFEGREHYRSGPTGPVVKPRTTLSDYDSFVSTVYRKYREQAFDAGVSGKAMPQLVEQTLPLESQMMSCEERDALNKLLLFEVLMRRTVAAKIGFRLRQSGLLPKKETVTTSASSTWSMSSGSSSHTPFIADSQRFGSTSHQRGAGTPNGSSGPSEYLPSPQISSTSQEKSGDSGQDSGQETASQLVPKQKTSLEKIAEDASLEQRPPSPPPHITSYNAVGNVQLSHLQPLNRSHETFSSFSSLTDTSLPGNCDSGDELFRSGPSGDTLFRPESRPAGSHWKQPSPHSYRAALIS